MPGPWTAADVTAAGTRPGIYINFQEAAAAAIIAGTRGTVGIISESDWGTPNAIVELTNIDDAVAAFTATESATARLHNLCRLAFLGGARTIKAARVMNTSGALKSTLNLNDTDGGGGTDVIQLDALYEGIFGDNIGVIIGDDPVDSTKTRIQVFVEGALVHTVISTVNHGSAGFVDDIIALFLALNSVWVTATKLVDGANDLANLASETALASGNNGAAVTATQVDTVLALFTTNAVNLITIDSVVAAIHTSVQNWAEARRAEGYYVMAVLGSDTGDASTVIITDSQAFNSEAVVYVGGGAVMPNTAVTSTIYNGATIAAMVAGIIAGAVIGRSATFFGLSTSTAVETSFTNAQIVSMLAAGVLVISAAPAGTNPGARIERGLTTLFNPGTGDIASFKLIRTVRIVDAIGEALTVGINASVVGIQLNDAVGQETVIGMVKDFLDIQAASRNILPTFTVVVDTGGDSSGPNLFLNIGITPIDAIEMIFTTVTLN